MKRIAEHSVMHTKIFEQLEHWQDEKTSESKKHKKSSIFAFIPIPSEQDAF